MGKLEDCEHLWGNTAPPDDVLAEYLDNDPVYRKITYRRFVSRSKGRRNGRKRERRSPKEVRLLKYCNGFHSWHLFPFDVYATEIIGQFADGDILKVRITSLWGY